MVAWVDGDDNDARVSAEAGRSPTPDLVAERHLPGHPALGVRHRLGGWQ